MSDFRVSRIGNISFAVSDLKSALEWLIRQTNSGVPVAVRLSNAYCVVLAEADREYAALFGSGVTFPDGSPVVVAMRASGEAVAGHVRGPSLFVSALRNTPTSVRHFFLGGSEITLARLTNRVSKTTEAVIAGSYSPPFGPVSEESVVSWAERIRASEANLTWVSLGTPKQDFAAARLAAELGHPVVAVGAAFDFYAGTVREAPEWIRKVGMEWFYRLMSEPRRLWRRYLIGNIRFIVIAGRSIMRNRRRPV